MVLSFLSNRKNSCQVIVFSSRFDFYNIMTAVFRILFIISCAFFPCQGKTILPLFLLLNTFSCGHCVIVVAV